MYNLCKMLHHQFTRKIGIAVFYDKYIEERDISNNQKKTKLQSIERNLLSTRNQIPQSKD